MKEKINLSKASQLYEDGCYEDAFKCYKELAEKGSADSQQFVGWMYQEGIGISKNEEEAFKWYKQAAELGSASAQFYLAKWYSKNRDYKESFGWYKKSASSNYSPALYRLGWFYEVGKYVTSDLDKAIFYYKKASGLGHIFALRNLGRILAKGYGGILNRFIGYYFIVKAFFKGIAVGLNDQESDSLRI